MGAIALVLNSMGFNYSISFNAIAWVIMIAYLKISIAWVSMIALVLTIAWVLMIALF